MGEHLCDPVCSRSGSGRLAGLVDAARHRLDVVHEQRRRADDGEVPLHARTSALVRCAPRRSAPGETAVTNLANALASPEQTGTGGVVDVGDDGDADRRRDPDLTSCRLQVSAAAAAVGNSVSRPGANQHTHRRPFTAPHC
jgi:hypothetical protein